MISSAELIQRAWKTGRVVPSFNIPYLPMMEPVVRALRDADSFGLVAVARLEWEKFGAGSPEAVAVEYQQRGHPRHTRLHLDHVPVLDEDLRRVDYLTVLGRALAAGFDSVMVDGSRLPLEENIACTREAAELAHAKGIPIEAELGAVMGHEDGPLPPYEELFASGKGFTMPEDARLFVRETRTDWLSVAIGNIHGAISATAKGQEKVRARLNLELLDRINRSAGVPLVLHGGSGIQREPLREAFRRGIAKVNIGAAVRQPYERAIGRSLAEAQQAAYEAARWILREELQAEGSAKVFQADRDSDPHSNLTH